MQIPILKGVYTGQGSDYRTSYPLNMQPILQSTGISEGYLKPIPGIVEIGTGPGVSRGAINWNGLHYRVMGEQLCRISSDGVVTELGSVGDDGNQVTMVYSFDRLAIASNKNLFYYNGTTLSQVTDIDLGDVVDLTWIDGYFMTTDGEYLVVTDLSDPTQVNQLKYGSSEADPDPVLALLTLRNEVYAINRYTIEVFTNVGSAFFPFNRIDGAEIYKGAIGTKAVAVHEDMIAFLGSGRNESPGIFLGANGQTNKISTPEIDKLIEETSEEQLQDVLIQSVAEQGRSLLYVFLPTITLVYDLYASKAIGEPVWFMASSAIKGDGPYRAKDLVWCYDKWYVGDIQDSKIGILDRSIATHYGKIIPWEFGTTFAYNEGRGILFKSLELIALTGRTEGFDEPMISTSYTLDGRTWSQERFIKTGKFGNRLKRLVWWRQGHMKNFRAQKFRGDSNTYISIARLEAEVEALSH